jgi:DNA-binding beta-propeller fold protein YncE
MHRLAIVLAYLALTATSNAHAESPRPLALPDGKPGIGFDDLRYDATLNRLLIPAGRTGNVDLIDPANLAAIAAIPGFTKLPRYDAGHGQSVTSVDAGGGFLFATDRNALSLAVIDPKSRRIVARATLASAPDYVRFVAATREVWVTEPGKKRIEVFTLPTMMTTTTTTVDNGAPIPTHAAFIDAPGGPESLVIDAARGRAYTHKWKTSTMAIDLKSRAVVATWPAGCADPRGIALDSARALLFIGCEDGTATALDVAHDGKLVGTVKSGSGVDIIAYDAGRAHLYVPGDESATLAIIGVASSGALSLLGTSPTAKDAHCVTTDERGNAYVCDPRNGQLLVVHDPYPPQK